jgi:hypothetical protein
MKNFKRIAMFLLALAFISPVALTAGGCEASVDDDGVEISED